MNKLRRKNIKKAMNFIEQATTLINDAISEEQDARDNLPENMQESEKAEKMDAWIEALEDSKSSIEDSFDSLDDAFDNE